MVVMLTPFFFHWKVFVPETVTGIDSVPPGHKLIDAGGCVVIELFEFTVIVPVAVILPQPPVSDIE